MIDTLLPYFDLTDNTIPWRNAVLRIGVVVLILGFELIATWLILFDHVKEKPDKQENQFPESGPEGSSDNSQTQTRTRRIAEFLSSLLFISVLTTVIAAFPWFYDHAWYGWLYLVPVAMGGFFYTREVSGIRLSLSVPQPPTAIEVRWLALATIVTAALILFRWNDVPPGMHRDIATICLSGITMWERNSHPFWFNGAGLPGLLDPIYGGAVLLSGSPIMGIRLYPFFCAILCPVVLYRLVCLIGSRQLAVFTTLVMVVSPFFQYYSRLPMGVSVWLMELFFLYGVVRSLKVRGPLGPLVAGIAVALAQWDYYASRGLVAVALAVPFICIPFYRSLERGWWYRLLFVALMGLLSLFSMTVLIIDYATKGYGIAFTPKYYDQSVTQSYEIIVAKIFGIFRMWFDSTGNAHNPLTIPSTPVQFGAFAGLLVIGTGLLIFSISRLPFYLLLLVFGCGACCSLFSDRPPNGHRALIAMWPVFVMVAYGASWLWGDQYKTGVPLVRLRRTMVILLMTCGVSASLLYFHHGMWKDPRAVSIQECDMYMRAMRVKARQDSYRVLITRSGYEHVKFLAGMTEFTFLNYSNWLPLNWDFPKKTAVEVAANMPSLRSLPESLPDFFDYHEWTTPVGTHCGWEYVTSDRLILGEAEVARQWAEEGRISGSLFLPASGILQVACKDNLISVESPVSTATAENSGSFQVIRGLNQVSLDPLSKNLPAPGYLRLEYAPAKGATEEHVISPGQLYKIPLCGWVEEVFAKTPAEISDSTPLMVSLVPTLYTHNMQEEVNKVMGRRIVTSYRSYPSLPPGSHRFVFILDEPGTIELNVGDKHLKWEGPIDSSTTQFNLDAQEVNGRMMEIIKTEKEAVVRFSLEVFLPGKGRGVPPYQWFHPYPDKE